MSTNDVSNISFMLNKPLDTTASQYVLEEKTIDAPVPVGQPQENNGTSNPVKQEELTTALSGDSGSTVKDLNSKLTTVNTNDIKEEGILNRFTKSVKSILKANNGKEISLEDKQAAFDYVSAHPNKIDDEDDDFKALSPDAQKYIKSVAAEQQKAHPEEAEKDKELIDS